MKRHAPHTQPPPPRRKPPFVPPARYRYKESFPTWWLWPGLAGLVLMFLGAWLFLRKQKRRKQNDLHLLVNKAKKHYDALRQDNNTSDKQLHQAEHHAREIEKILSHLSSPQHISSAQRAQLNIHTQALEEIAKADR